MIGFEYALALMPRHMRGRGISLLVPFRADTPDRQIILDWLVRYYEYHLPHAEIIIGEDDGHPFSKTCAVNDAATIARGDVYVILDADCYIDVRQILTAAYRIRHARENGRREWYIPYRGLFRLTHAATLALLESDPELPYLRALCDQDQLPDPHPPLIRPADHQVENQDGSGHGHWFGALIQVMPREAFEAVGGMEPRCRGWGVDDVAFMMALDTLYARHRTLPGSVVTPDHVVFGERHHRKWVGQERRDPNGNLGSRYRAAWGDPGRMRALVDEGFES